MEKSSIERGVQERLSRIEETINEACLAAGRDRREVTLMAVTKTVEPERINAALRAGVTCIGENRVQEFLKKKDELLLSGVSCHLIGSLQTNKVRQIVGEVAMIQSVDRPALAREINRCSEKIGRVSDVLLEVNIGEETSKSGVAVRDLPALLEETAALPFVRVRGLMCIPPISDEERVRRQYFSEMYKLFVDTKDKNMDNICMDILSMGMSADYREAILEGATMVRVGTALFGHRPAP